MGGRPTRFVDDTLIVFEGPARVSWTLGRDGQWTPVQVWPAPRHRELLRRRLDSGAPILVVLDRARAPVAVLREEWDRAPGAVRASLAVDGPPADDGVEVLELRVPMLDWLPRSQRVRAEDFLVASDQVLAGTPRALRPPLLVDDRQVCGVRFVRRLLPGLLSTEQLVRAVRHVAQPALAGA
jgi:hypothetical protein